LLFSIAQLGFNASLPFARRKLAWVIANPGAGQTENEKLKIKIEKSARFRGAALRPQPRWPAWFVFKSRWLD